MQKVQIPSFRLIGIGLPFKTTNDYGRSAVDCGGLWHKFMSEGLHERIPGMVGPEIHAVYHDYDGDHSQPYAFFLGCKVHPETEVPEGLASLEIPTGDYAVVTARGVLPESVMKAWSGIWQSGMVRAYRPDFEVYGERTLDPEHSEVDIFISI
jgi:predicted transcriptional regulator YdeE